MKILFAFAVGLMSIFTVAILVLVLLNVLANF